MGEPHRRGEVLRDDVLRDEALPDAAQNPTDDDPTEAEIDEVLAEFGGDARAAIRALLHDFDMLAADARAALFRQDWRDRRNRAPPRGRI